MNDQQQFSPDAQMQQLVGQIEEKLKQCEIRLSDKTKGWTGTRKLAEDVVPLTAGLFRLIQLYALALSDSLSKAIEVRFAALEQQRQEDDAEIIIGIPPENADALHDRLKPAIEALERLTAEDTDVKPTIEEQQAALAKLKEAADLVDQMTLEDDLFDEEDDEGDDTKKEVLDL